MTINFNHRPFHLCVRGGRGLRVGTGDTHHDEGRRVSGVGSTLFVHLPSPTDLGSGRVCRVVRGRLSSSDVGNNQYVTL